jgi:hypothetical protein
MIDINLLITKEEFQADKLIPQSTDTARVEKAIREAQQFDIRPLLGDALYYDLLKNTTEEKYQSLLNGEEYQNAQSETILFSGLRMAIKYYAYSRFILSQQVNVTSHSVVEKLNQYSQPSQEKTIVREAEQAKSGAAEYWNEAKAYLNCKSTDFPLWKRKNATPKSAFKITAIGGRD